MTRKKSKTPKPSKRTVLPLILPVRSKTAEGSLKLKKARKPYTCRNCMQLGHNRRTCQNAPLAVVRNDIIDLNAMANETKIRDTSTRKRSYTCGNCNQLGHNKRTCSRAIMQHGSNQGMEVDVPAADAVSKGPNQRQQEGLMNVQHCKIDYK